MRLSTPAVFLAARLTHPWDLDSRGSGKLCATVVIAKGGRKYHIAPSPRHTLKSKTQEAQRIFKKTSQAEAGRWLVFRCRWGSDW